MPNDSLATVVNINGMAVPVYWWLRMRLWWIRKPIIFSANASSRSSRRTFGPLFPADDRHQEVRLKQSHQPWPNWKPNGGEQYKRKVLVRERLDCGRKECKCWYKFARTTYLTTYERRHRIAVRWLVSQSDRVTSAWFGDLFSHSHMPRRQIGLDVGYHFVCLYEFTALQATQGGEGIFLHG